MSNLNRDNIITILTYMKHEQVIRLLKSEYYQLQEKIKYELFKIAYEHRGMPLFIALNCELYRPYNQSYSGARQIGIDYYNLHEPYLNAASTVDEWSDRDSDSDSDSINQ